MSIRKWVAFGFMMVSTVAVLAVVTGVVSSAQTCKKVKGQFTLTTVTGPTCASPAGLCADLSYKGDIKGTGFFIGTSLIPTADTPTTGVIILTGDNTIHTSNGDLLTKDAITFKTTGAGEFAEVDVVVGGTGQWLGFTGTLTATGTFTAAGGEGRYDGEICAP